MTDKEKTENDVDTQSNDSNNNNNDNNTPFTDVQLVGGIIFALLVITGGLMMFGGAGMGSADDFNYPEWADENGITVNEEGQPNTQAASQSHETTLSSTSYTILIEGTNENADGDTDRTELDYKYNEESQTALGVQTVNGESTETYDEFIEQRQFLVQNLDTDDVEYDRTPIFQGTPYTAGNEFIELMSVLNVEAVGTVSNGDVVVYEVTGVNEERAGDVPITVNGEISLHTDGYFTDMDMTIRNTEQDITTTQNVQITDVGSTTVDEPDWLQDAIEQTDELTEDDYEQPSGQQPIPEPEPEP